MGTSTRNLTKLSLPQLSLRRLAANFGVWVDSPSLVNPGLQCRAYTRSPHHLSKIRVTGSSPLSHKSALSNSYSSSSKMGFLGWYLAMLDSRPIITKAITASIIYAAADLTAQMITFPPSGSFDPVRTLRMAGFGILVVGPSQHMWFNFVARIIPKRDVVSPLKKLTMGQVIYAPCLNGSFFSFNAALRGESGDEIVARLERDLLPTLLKGLVFWSMCDFLTYKVIPVHLQPLINGSIS